MLIYFVIIPIIVAVFLYLFPFPRLAKIIALLVQLGLLIAVTYLFYITRQTEVVTVIGPYTEALGIILRADYLSAVFVLLTAFIFLMVTLYSFNDKISRLFWLLLFIWEGVIIGVFLTSDLFNVFVLMEVATLVVTILIMFNKEKRSMYDGLIYIMINFVGIQFYLLGLGYLYRNVGILELNAVAQSVSLLETSQLVLPYAFIMTFIGLKCALLPLFSWLPKAHSTPGASPAVSALLSGLHIKTGVYLFLRFQIVFQGIGLEWLFVAIGLVTAVVGVIMAISQKNIKRILAYSTIAQVGLIIAGISLGSVYNFTGAVFHVVNHALFKAVLFLAAGIIADAYASKNITEIRGVLKQLPIVGFATIFAILGIIGMPGFNGSISKYFLMYEVGWLLNAIMVAINFGTITVFVRYATIFFGKPKTPLLPENLTAYRDKFKQFPIVILAVFCLIFGVFGNSVISLLFNWEAQIDMLGYLEKSAIFAVSLAVGWLVYSKLLKGRILLDRISEIDLGFRGMCAALGVFFAVILLTVGFFG
ncbi:MAG: proton-conducting membrane transporter [Defluviitaleaceae bacterium]|nr:proton-conducting membrane transporter [Defluviitaleaceae bacterium]